MQLFMLADTPNQIGKKSKFYVHAYIYTYICTYILWIHKWVKRAKGCGTSHIYTNIHNCYSVKYYKHFTKQ